MQQAIYSLDNGATSACRIPATATSLRRSGATRTCSLTVSSRRCWPPALRLFDQLQEDRPGYPAEHEHAIWEKLGLKVGRRTPPTRPARRRGLAQVLVRQERAGDTAGTVTGVASFGIFVTLDTLHVEAASARLRTGRRAAQFNDALHGCCAANKPTLPPDRQGAGAGIAGRSGSPPDRVSPGAGHYDALRKAAARGRTKVRAV